MEKDINSIDLDINSNNLSYKVPSEFDNYYFGKALQVNNKKTCIIGVIDASGSMSSCWSTLVSEWNLLVDENLENLTTIIFSNSSSVIREKYLQVSHVGGGTHICSGFEEAYKEILKLSETEKDFTIIFISDGDDGNMSTISSRIQKLLKPNDVTINLICVGVGSGFPTFVAMELREKYHNGMSSIPAVFLVSDYKVEFATNFVSIREYLNKLEKVRVTPGVKLYPWTENLQDEIFESCNFICLEPEVKINDIIVKTLRSDQLTKKDLELVFKAWTQDLQIKSLKESVKSQAKMAVNLMEYLYQIYIEKTSETNVNKQTLSVLERLELREKKSGTHLLQSLIGECKKMRDGASLKDLSAEEAAKRLAIGTQQGKYHHKALQMRGITQEDYSKFKLEFFEKLEKVKLNPDTLQEPSFILLQNQKEIFMEPTLKTAIEKCNAYELVEVMPMVGHTLLIRRTDQSMINPYTIQVISIPKINKVCDTISLVSQGNEMEISIGNDEEEKFNAVLPLFEFSDKDMKSLIRSKLFHLLMTFNVMRNVDTFFYEAYAGLLANTLVRLIKYPDSAWKFQMIDLVYSTTEMVYGENPIFESSCNLLLNDPRGAMVTEHKTERHKCEDISKMILNLLVLQKRNKLSEDQCHDIIMYMLIEHAGRNIKEGTNVFETFLGPSQVQNFRLNTKKDKTNIKTDDNSNNLKQDKDQVQSERDQAQVDNKVVNNTMSSNVEENVKTDIIDINSFDPSLTVVNIKTNPNTNVVDINSEVIDINIPQLEINDEDSLDQIVEKFIRNREHLKFDSIKDLKINLKKVFLDFISRKKSTNSMNIRLNKEIFNKPGYRINFSFFYELYEYFCPSKSDFDDKLFWIAVNHALKYRDSHDRSVNVIDMNYDSIRETQKKKYFDKQDKSEKEKLYDSFEASIVDNYLLDFKNAMKMVRDFHCNTNLLKNCARYDSKKPFVNVLFFGPQSSGKSTLTGKLMKEMGCIDEKEFEYYKTAYKTFYPNRENEPFEWITDTSVDQRCKGRTMILKINYLNTNKKLVNIYDTPGKNKYYEKALSAMALVDQYFLCVEGNINISVDDLAIIKASIPSLSVNGCSHLYILLTKTEKYVNENDVNSMGSLIEHFKKIIDDLLDKLKIKLNVTILPVSSYTGFNLNELINIFDSLDRKKEINENINSNNLTTFSDSNLTKLLVLDTIDNNFDNKVIYAQVFGDNFHSGCSFVSYPSGTQSKVTNVQVNYNKTSEIPNGIPITVQLLANSKQLKISKGSILHINEKPKKEEKKMKIEKLEISICYIGKPKLKKNTSLVIEYRYFKKTFQIASISDKDKNDIPCYETKNKKDRNEVITISLVPVSSIYFENLWNDQKADRIIIRGKHYGVDGVGKITNIKYN